MLMRGDLVATRFGLLWVDRRLEEDGRSVGYVGLTLLDSRTVPVEVQFESADVSCVYRPAWQRR